MSHKEARSMYAVFTGHSEIFVYISLIYIGWCEIKKRLKMNRRVGSFFD